MAAPNAQDHGESALSIWWPRTLDVAICPRPGFCELPPLLCRGIPYPACNTEVDRAEERAQGRRGRARGWLGQTELGPPDRVRSCPRVRRDIDDRWPWMGRSPFEGPMHAIASVSERNVKRCANQTRSTRSRARGVLDIPRQRQRVELLGEVLIDWIDGEP